MSASQDPYDDVIDVQPLGPALAATSSSTLARTPTLEVRWLVLAKGHEVPPTRPPGKSQSIAWRAGSRSPPVVARAN